MTEELPHIRCLECGKPIAHLWNSYQTLLGNRVKPEQALTQLGLTRYCCRMWMQSPFKVPMRSDRQDDPRDMTLERQGATVTTTRPKQQLLSPLQTMANPEMVPIPPQGQTIGYTVVPTGGVNIELPAIPDVPLLPPIPTAGETTDIKQVTRTYQAW